MLPTRPLRSDVEHAAALREIELLWNAQPGTSDFDRLDLLSTLVDAYEREHHRIGPPTPRGYVEYAIDQGMLTASDLLAIAAHAA